MGRDKVTRLRQLLSEAVPTSTHKTSAETDAWREFQYYGANALPPPLELRWQAKAIREINRVAIWYHWTGEVQRYLDEANVLSLASLDDTQLEKLHARMKTLEDCVQNGCGAPDAPPGD